MPLFLTMLATCVYIFMILAKPMLTVFQVDSVYDEPHVVLCQTVDTNVR